MFVVYGPRGGIQPVEPIETPDSIYERKMRGYWMRVAPWPRFRGLREDECDMMDEFGRDSEIAFEVEP